MVVQQQIDEATYEEIALNEPDVQWELYDGKLRERPGMIWEHGSVISRLARQLLLQLDHRQLELRINEGRVRRPGSIFIPDLIVVSTSYGEVLGGSPGKLAVFSDPLPLVVEVWSNSTGDYDVDAKLPVYMQRGDQEIWRIHPYDRTLTAWRRQPDDAYTQTMYRKGPVRPVALPNVTINLDELFEVGNG